MQSDSSSLDTLKDSLLRAVDAEYNVIDAETVLAIICQLEKLIITKEQLQTTRLGREINTIRQKIDAKKKNTQTVEQCSQLIIEIAHRAKKLLRSWQGLINTCQNDLSTSTTNEDVKPRLILKVKLNSPIEKRKSESDSHLSNKTNIKRQKTQVIETPMPLKTSASSSSLLTETNNTLPRLKTTQELLLEMQMNEPNVLSTQTSTVNAILQKKILDESLYQNMKIDYSALHNGKDLNVVNAKSLNYQKQLSSTATYEPNPKRKTLSQHLTERLISSNTNWETGSNAGSPISPLSSSSSSSLSSTSLWAPSTNIPEVSLPVPHSPKVKFQINDNDEQSKLSFNIESICSSYNTVAELVQDHRRRVLAEHDARELEARPDLLLVPMDQLAFVYEREITTKLNVSTQIKCTCLTTVEQLNQSSNLIALPFIDCSLDYDLALDELVI